MKGMVCQGCVRSVMLYGSNVWCKTDGEKEDRGPNGMLGLKETVVQMAKANGVKWYGHMLRRDDEHVLRKALDRS